MTPQGSKQTHPEYGTFHRTNVSATNQWHEKIKRDLRDIKLNVTLEPCLNPNPNEPTIKRHLGDN